MHDAVNSQSHHIGGEEAPRFPRRAKRHLLSCPAAALFRRRIIAFALIGAPLALLVGGPVTVTRAEDYHVVRPGDTLSDIADRHNKTVEELLRLNNLSDPNLIKSGMSLQLSARSSPAATASNQYRVVEGDTLSGIAARFGVTYLALAQANSLVNPDFLRPGEVLAIPAAPKSP
jgi:LysM repeat protein